MRLDIIALLLISITLVSQIDGSPKRKSSGGGWGNKKKGGLFGSKKVRTLGKAAAIGAGAYGAYQLGKAAGRFSNFGHRGYGFHEWNRWRQQDGMLCRSDLDCAWIDPEMGCEDYEFDFSINRGWFGGDYLSVVGECECQNWTTWDNWELRCRFSIFPMIGIVGLILALLVGCCACAGVYVFCRR